MLAGLVSRGLEAVVGGWGFGVSQHIAFAALATCRVGQMQGGMEWILFLHGLRLALGRCAAAVLCPCTSGIETLSASLGEIFSALLFKTRLNNIPAGQPVSRAETYPPRGPEITPKSFTLGSLQNVSSEFSRWLFPGLVLGKRLP